MCEPFGGRCHPECRPLEIARKSLNIPIHIIIRPRGGALLYSDIEFEVMKRDIGLAERFGADGVVFGILSADGEVDRQRTRELVEQARPLNVTFHRGFDMTCDPYRAIEDLIELGINRVLTSGQSASAPEGVNFIRGLVDAARVRLAVMAAEG